MAVTAFWTIPKKSVSIVASFTGHFTASFTGHRGFIIGSPNVRPALTSANLRKEINFVLHEPHSHY